MFLVALTIIALGMIMTGAGIEFKMEFYAGPLVDSNEDEEDQE